jgi:excinuclease UvrABC helicase subunit UvrB
MDREERIEALERAMHEAAARMEFEKAAQYRDELRRLRTVK